MKYKTKTIIYIVLVALFICDAAAQDFNGSWGTNDSSYYLTINDKDFSTYKFVPSNSTGIEKFVKQEDNIIVTNYWIDEQEYYVKVTYTLINEDNLKAEFNGKLKGEFYYSIINYKRVKVENR